MFTAVRFETEVPAASVTTSERTSATEVVPPITAFATVVTIFVASPKNVTVSVARALPAAEEIVIVATPEFPSGNTVTKSPFLTVIARPIGDVVKFAPDQVDEEPSVPGPAMLAVNDSAVTAAAAALSKSTLIVAEAFGEATSAFEPVTVTSAVAVFVSPALMIEVAEAATVSSDAAVVTVIVTVCAVALSAPPPPVTAGVTLTTYVPVTVGAAFDAPPTYTRYLAVTT